MSSFSTNLNTPIMSEEQRFSDEREKLSPSLFFAYFHNNTDQNLKQTQEMTASLTKFKPSQGFEFVLQNIQMCMVNNTRPLTRCKRRDPLSFIPISLLQLQKSWFSAIRQNVDIKSS